MSPWAELYDFMRTFSMMLKYWQKRSTSLMKFFEEMSKMNYIGKYWKTFDLIDSQ